MTAVTFDTLMYAKKLQDKGFTAEQAEASVEMIKEIMDSQLASKHDIDYLRRDIEDTRRDIKESENKIILRLGSIMVAGFGVMGIILSLISKVH